MDRLPRARARSFFVLCFLGINVTAGCSQPDPNAIPGFEVSEVQEAFEELGFKANDAEVRSGMEELELERNRGRRQHRVIIRGPDGSQIVSVSAVSIVPAGNDDRAESMEFFQAAATYSFDTALEKAAREWVEHFYDSGGSTVIGPVKLQLKMQGVSRRLEMTRAKPASEPEAVADNDAG